LLKRIQIVKPLDERCDVVLARAPVRFPLATDQSVRTLELCANQ